MDSSWSWYEEQAARAEDSWAITVQRLPIGTKVSGTVIARQPFGVFIEIDGHPDALGLADGGLSNSAQNVRLEGHKTFGPSRSHHSGGYRWHDMPDKSGAVAALAASAPSCGSRIPPALPTDGVVARARSSDG
jgi:hypothetical protein